MNNLTISKSALNRAERWYQGARRAFEDERWDDVIYSYQMTVEHTLKAILILFGIEYPKIHNISPVYLELGSLDIPEWFLNKVDFHATILEELTEKRGLSAYGYVSGVSKDYFKEDANNYESSVKEILADCKRLIKEFSQKQNLKKK
ncbi:MAG: HEPN domain-containing protein [Promethearchaeota archaeon]